MVAASKAAQILAQMFGKLQKYGLENRLLAPRHLGQDYSGREKGSSVS